MNIYFYYTSDKSTGAPGAQNHEYEYEHFLLGMAMRQFLVMRYHSAS